MRICPNSKCGKNIENDKAKFCRYCGTQLPAIPEPPILDGEVSNQVIPDSDDGITLPPPNIPPRIEPVAGSHPGDGISLGFAHNAQIPRLPTNDNGHANHGYPPTPPKKPQSNLVWAILSTLLCCFIFGIVAIVYASKVSSLYYSGDYQGAQKASSKAAMWSIVAAVVGALNK